MSVDPGLFAEAIKRPSSPEGRLIPDGVENGGIGHRARQARQKRRSKRDGQACNRRMIDPALDGLSELIELGKERAKRPAFGGLRPFMPKGRHVCTRLAARA